MYFQVKLCLRTVVLFLLYYGILLGQSLEAQQTSIAQDKDKDLQVLRANAADARKEVNYSLAIQLYQQSVQKEDNKESLIALAELYNTPGTKGYDPKHAWETYVTAADQGNKTALLYLAKALENGAICPSNYSKAFTLYQAAAVPDILIDAKRKRPKQIVFNHSSVFADIAECYRKGKGTAPNPVLAYYYYQLSLLTQSGDDKASDNPHWDAVFAKLSDEEKSIVRQMLYAFQQSYHMSKPIDSAQFLFKENRNRNCQLYEENRREILALRARAYHSRENGNLEAAAQMYQNAVQLGDTEESLIKLGEIYNTPGTKIYDAKRSWDAYVTAAENGNKMAFFYLANAYEEGTICPRDYAQAFMYYQAAAMPEIFIEEVSFSQGILFYNTAFMCIAKCYQQGKGTQKNLILAYYNYCLAKITRLGDDPESYQPHIDEVKKQLSEDELKIAQIMVRNFLNTYYPNEKCNKIEEQEKLK